MPVTTDTPDKIISVTTILNCSPDKAFNYFTDYDLLTRWLTQKADVELKEARNINCSGLRMILIKPTIVPMVARYYHLSALTI
jgi:hypothetical protein